MNEVQVEIECQSCLASMTLQRTKSDLALTLLTAWLSHVCWTPKASEEPKQAP